MSELPATREYERACKQRVAEATPSTYGANHVEYTAAAMQDELLARIAGLKGQLQDAVRYTRELEAENKKAIYGCCEECEVASDNVNQNAHVTELERYLKAGREEWELGCKRIAVLETGLGEQDRMLEEAYESADFDEPLTLDEYKAELLEQADASAQYLRSRAEEGKIPLPTGLQDLEDIPYGDGYGSDNE